MRWRQHWIKRVQVDLWEIFDCSLYFVAKSHQTKFSFSWIQFEFCKLMSRFTPSHNTKSKKRTISISSYYTFVAVAKLSRATAFRTHEHIQSKKGEITPSTCFVCVCHSHIHFLDLFDGKMDRKTRITFFERNRSAAESHRVIYIGSFVEGKIVPFGWPSDNSAPIATDTNAFEHRTCIICFSINVFRASFRVQKDVSKIIYSQRKSKKETMRPVSGMKACAPSFFPFWPFPFCGTILFLYFRRRLYPIQVPSAHRSTQFYVKKPPHYTLNWC